MASSYDVHGSWSRRSRMRMPPRPWDTDDAAADFNGDGLVGASDILLVLSAWGPCEQETVSDTLSPQS
ncbi:MAG: hypothetical protein MK101_00025 [Phycisphaerales bacterium]|nr:hypothetical protein [Phycisphaerales bacterium]